MKTQLFLALFLFIHCYVDAIDLPKKFFITQPWCYTDGSVLTVKTDKQNLGLVMRSISGNVFTGRIPKYDLYSEKNGLEAVAKVGPSDNCLKTIFFISTDQGLLGTIEEDFQASCHHPFFKIYSATHELLATGHSEWYNTTLTLSHPENKQILVSSTSLGKIFHGNWTVKIKDHSYLKKIDPRLLILTLSIFPDRRFHYLLGDYTP